MILLCFTTAGLILLLGLLYFCKKQRKLIAGITGSYLVFTGMAIYLPQIENLRFETTIRNMDKSIPPALIHTMQQFEKYARQHQTLDGTDQAITSLPELPSLRYINISPKGEIVTQQDIQGILVVYVLTPHYQNNRVRWRCRGTPNYAMPAQCQTKDNLTSVLAEKEVP